MALSTYENIQTSIRRWIWDRDDLSGLIPDWIVLNEARCNDILRTAQMETQASITLTAGAGSLPANYLEWRSVQTQDSPRRRLQWAEPDWAEYEFSSTAGTSLSTYFTIIGSTIKTYPSSPTDLTLFYYRTIPPLADNPTGNWLSARSPGIYIYGALLEAEPFLGDDERIAQWGTMFDNAVQGLMKADRGARYAKATMRIDGATP